MVARKTGLPPFNFFKLNWKVLYWQISEMFFNFSAMEILVLRDYRAFSHLELDFFIRFYNNKTSRKKMLTWPA